jgi:hypothetical protein
MPQRLENEKVPTSTRAGAEDDVSTIQQRRVAKGNGFCER